MGEVSYERMGRYRDHTENSCIRGREGNWLYACEGELAIQWQHSSFVALSPHSFDPAAEAKVNSFIFFS